jgi:predicted transposase YdaD
VLTVLLLLCKQANSPGLVGRYTRQLPDGWLTNRYNYRVVRLWKEDPESFLIGGANLVPLAPLANVAKAALPGLVRLMAERINAEPRPRADKLWTATYLLMGLRYEETFTSKLLEGVQDMRESTTYQAILREGRIEGRVSEAQRLLLMLGEDRLGQPDETIQSAIAAIHDVERLEGMSRRVYSPSVRDWENLVGTP